MGRFWGTYKPELLFLFDIFTHDHLLTPPSPSVYIIADQPCLLFKMLPPPRGGLCVSAVVGCLVGLHGGCGWKVPRSKSRNLLVTCVRGDVASLIGELIADFFLRRAGTLTSILDLQQLLGLQTALMQT